MSFDIGINFRATAGFVTDGTGETYSLGEPYPVTRGGATFGWSVDLTANGRDRSASIDRRLAGIVFSNNTSHYFRLDLPSTGTYRIHLAVGDFATQANPVDWDIKDTTTLLFQTTGNPTNQGDFKDATNTNYNHTVWPSQQQPVEVTMATTQLRIYVAGTGGNRVIAHVRVRQMDSGAPAPRLLALSGAGR